MTKHHDFPTVELRTLVNSSGYLDKTFERYVSEWFRTNMPSVRIGLLDTGNVDRWRLEPECVHSVRPHMWAVWECLACGGETINLDGEPPTTCCEEENERPEFQMDSRKAYILWNDTTNEPVGFQRYIRYERLSEDHSDLIVDRHDDVLGWDHRGEAEDAAERADRAYDSEHGAENSYGFPWANSWAYMPDGYIKDEDLKKAGFRVATYCGGSGNWRNDEEFRLCGIDGGGYSFAESHWAKLVAYHHERRDACVATDNGHAYITTDYRADLEKLADVVNE